MPTFLLLAGLSGAIAVALGAFGAHGLRSRLSPDQLATFETAVRYQFYHVPGLLGAAWLATYWPGYWPPIAAGWLFLVGSLVFSGSLYLLVLSGRRWLGAITPLGGLALIAGWLCLALTALRI